MHVHTLRIVATVSMLLLALSARSGHAGQAATGGAEPAWSVSVRGLTAVCAPVLNDRVATFDDHGTMHLRDLRTGVLLSEVTIGTVPDVEPTAVDGSIIVADSTGTLGSFRLDTQKWNWRLGGLPPRHSPPVRFGERLYIGTGGDQGGLVCIEAASGKVLFRVSLPEQVLTTPVAFDKAVYVATTAGSIFRIDAGSGNARRVFGSAGEFIGQKLALSGRRLLASPSGYHRSLECLTLEPPAATLDRVWHVPFTRPRYAGTESIRDVLFLRPSSRDQLLPQALAKSVGFSHRQFDPASDFVATGAVHTSGWTVRNGLAAAVVRESGVPPQALYHVVVVDPRNGARITGLSRLGESAPTLSCAEPCIWGHNVIACIDRTTLVNLNAVSGALEWEWDAGAPISSGPIAAGDFAIVTTATAISAFRVGTAANLPSKYRFHANAPNPFTVATSLKFDLPSTGRVALQILDSKGGRAATLIDGEMDAGYHSVTWDGRDDLGRKLAAGMYVARFEAGRYTRSVRMNMLR